MVHLLGLSGMMLLSIAICRYCSHRLYSLELQENDFGGWPPLEELPVSFMTDEHMYFLIKKCSRKKTGHSMPHFTAALTPSKTHSPVDVTNTVTPLPNDPKQEKCTKKPSKQALALHRKWQETAETMGGPGARIIVGKPQAKEKVFSLLFDAFRPMNITEIYQARPFSSFSQYISIP